MQCPIDRAPHTMAFGISVMGTLRERSVTARALIPQSPYCEATTVNPAPLGRPKVNKLMLITCSIRTGHPLSIDDVPIKLIQFCYYYIPKFMSNRLK